MIQHGTHEYSLILTSICNDPTPLLLYNIKTIALQRTPMALSTGSMQSRCQKLLVMRLQLKQNVAPQNRLLYIPLNGKCKSALLCAIVCFLCLQIFHIFINVKLLPTAFCIIFSTLLILPTLL